MKVPGVENDCILLSFIDCSIEVRRSGMKIQWYMVVVSNSRMVSSMQIWGRGLGRQSISVIQL